MSETFKWLNLLAMIFDVVGTLLIVNNKDTAGIFALAIGTALLLAAFVGRDKINQIDTVFDCQDARGVNDCAECKDKATCKKGEEWSD